MLEPGHIHRKTGRQEGPIENPSRPCRLPVQAALLALTLLLPSGAHAQPLDPQRTAAAELLYKRATAELDAKNYASACRKLEEVTVLVPDALGAKLTLGACYEGLGKLASAWKQYSIVDDMAALTEQLERQKKAAAKVAALRPRLATLDIKMALDVASIPGLVITCDGAALDEARWWAPLPVDVGSHTIEVTAPGRRAWQTQVEVTANGKAVPVAIESPALKSGVAVNSPAPPVRAAPADSPAPAAAGGLQRSVGLGVMGLGAVGVGVGAVLGGLALAKNAESNDGHCDAHDRCDPTGVDLRKGALGLGDASTAVLLVGGMLVAGGIVLFVTASSEANGQAPVSARKVVRAQIELLPAGLGVRGTW